MIGSFFILFATLFVAAQSLPEGCPDRLSGSQLQGFFEDNSGPLIERARQEGQRCMERIAKSFTHYVAQQQGISCTPGNCSPWNQNFLGECAPGATAEDCERAKASQERQTTNLRRFIVVSLAPVELSPEEVERMCLILTPENPLELIRRAGIAEVLQEFDCSELPVGQSRNITTSINNGETFYQLVRENPQTYRLNVPINFLANEGVSSDELSGFQQRIRGCIERYNGALLGPNGEQLSIGIIDRLPGNKTNIVNVFQTMTRENSRNYSLNIPCSTVVHEVLHLTGLVDEYRETDPDLGYECRIHAAETSIMANDLMAANSLSSEISCSVQPVFQQLWSRLSERERALLLTPQLGEILDRARFCIARPDIERIPLNEAVTRESLSMRELEKTTDRLSFEAFVPVIDQESASGWIEKRTIDCQCTPGSFTKCHSWINNPPTRNIDLTNTREQCPAFMTGESRVVGETESSTLLTANGMVIRRRGRMPSLLSPNHFNRILAGSCQRRAQDYNICASWAYTRECAPVQNTCFDRPGVCSGPPAQCTSERLLGRVQGQ